MYSIFVIADLSGTIIESLYNETELCVYSLGDARTVLHNIEQF